MSCPSFGRVASDSLNERPKVSTLGPKMSKIGWVGRLVGGKTISAGMGMEDSRPNGWMYDTCMANQHGLEKLTKRLIGFWLTARSLLRTNSIWEVNGEKCFARTSVLIEFHTHFRNFFLISVMRCSF